MKWIAVDTLPALNDTDFFLPPVISADVDTFSGPKDRGNLAKKKKKVCVCVFKDNTVCLAWIEPFPI